MGAEQELEPEPDAVRVVRLLEELRVVPVVLEADARELGGLVDQERRDADALVAEGVVAAYVRELGVVPSAPIRIFAAEPDRPAALEAPEDLQERSPVVERLAR